MPYGPQQNPFAVNGGPPQFPGQSAYGPGGPQQGWQSGGAPTAATPDQGQNQVPGAWNPSHIFGNQLQMFDSGPDAMRMSELGRRVASGQMSQDQANHAIQQMIQRSQRPGGGTQNQNGGGSQSGPMPAPAGPAPAPGAPPSLGGGPAQAPPGGFGGFGGMPIDPRTGGPSGFPAFPGASGPPMYQGQALGRPDAGGGFGRPDAGNAPAGSPRSGSGVDLTGYNPNQDAIAGAAKPPGGAPAPGGGAPSVGGFPAQVGSNPFPRPSTNRPAVSAADQAAAVAADRAMFQPGGSQYHGPAAGGGVGSGPLPPPVPVPQGPPGNDTATTDRPPVPTPQQPPLGGPPRPTPTGPPGHVPTPQGPPINPPPASLTGASRAQGGMADIAQSQAARLRPRPRPTGQKGTMA